MDDTEVPRETRELFPGRWLAATADIQRDAYGYKPEEMTDPERVEYVRWNVLAAVDELHEALGETDWKPWSSTKGEGGVRNRDAFIGELVDAMHFVGNLLFLVGCDDAELDRRYQTKLQVNRDRQASGTYDAVTGKCEICGRDFADVGVTCTPTICLSPMDRYAGGGHPLEYHRGIASFIGPDADLDQLRAAGRALCAETPARELIGVHRTGYTVYVESAYTARGANSYELRRFTANVAARAGHWITVDDVTLHSVVDHRVVAS